MNQLYKGIAFSALILAAVFGVVDPALAFGVMLVGDLDMKALVKETKDALTAMQDAVKRAQDSADKAIDEVKREGTLHKETNDKLTELATAAQDLGKNYKSLADRLQEVEQKADKKPTNDQPIVKTAGQLVAESEAIKAMIASKQFNSAPVQIDRKTIMNATGQNQPLVPSDRQAGIIMPSLRRLTIRDLLPQIRTTSNLIEYAKENVFTNSAGPQGGATSPTVAGGEGEVKPESNITFTLSTSAVITLAHWIAASRQVMSDAPQLQGYIDTRLQYGLKLEEEDELLNSSGTGGELNGLRNQATAFNGSNTNASALDTLLRAFTQVSLADYEASGVILHPTDWMNIMLLKDTTGRYLFSDPHSTELPRVWGKDVVPTASMTQGQFLAGAFNLACAIYDREDMSIRMSDQHEQFFVKNLVAILCEERLALVVYRPQALVAGAISHAG
jgi:HK97 family phage major capsid protein